MLLIIFGDTLCLLLSVYCMYIVLYIVVCIKFVHSSLFHCVINPDDVRFIVLCASDMYSG